MTTKSIRDYINLIETAMTESKNKQDFEHHRDMAKLATDPGRRAIHAAKATKAGQRWDNEKKQTTTKQGVAEGSDTAPETAGKFLYNTLTKSLNDINIPYQQGTDEYNRFVQSYKKAMADQDRKYLRLGMEPEKLAKYLGIQDGAKWIRKAQGVPEEQVEESTPDAASKVESLFRDK